MTDSEKAKSASFWERPSIAIPLDVVSALTVTFVLSMWLNVRYPVDIPTSDHFLLAFEVPVTLGVLAALRFAGVRLRWWMFPVLAALAVATRVFWTADNIVHKFLYRDFRIPLDLHLVPEFFRLLYDTSEARQMVGRVAMIVLGIGLSFALAWGSLVHVYSRARRKSYRYLIWGLLGLSLIAQLSTELGGPRLSTREFSKRIGKEVIAFTKLPAQRRQISKQIAEVAQRIGEGERLDKLQGNNVLLFFVESYGRTSLVIPEHREILVPKYEAMGEALKKAGFHVASNFITSPTFGGFSWFAHGTLNTGFKVISHLHASLLEAARPPALADYFRDAGYLPIIVAPGTTRAWPGMDDRFGFRKHYFSWELGYRGPRYAWATMADQYVLNYMHQREISRAAQPLFVQFALVCSHAPFTDVPNYVEDWSKLGNGSMLHRVGRKRFDVGWGQNEELPKAYSAAVAYELQVIEGYLLNLVKDDSLIIFMGDHQPNQLVTGPDNLTWSVPVHIASRNPDFVKPFLDRGYIPGMLPTQPLPHVGMERFMEEFLADFSTEPLAVEPGLWPPAKKHLELREQHRAKASTQEARAPDPIDAAKGEARPEEKRTAPL